MRKVNSGGERRGKWRVVEKSEGVRTIEEEKSEEWRRGEKKSGGEEGGQKREGERRGREKRTGEKRGKEDG